jgi:hypothetical protein
MLYKYSYYLEYPTLPTLENQSFPFPSLILYSIATSLYLVPLYRVVIPNLIEKQKYMSLALFTVIYLAFGTKISFVICDYIFLQFCQENYLSDFFRSRLDLSTSRITLILKGWDFKILLTDLMAFASISFVKIAFENSIGRLELQKNNLQLQLDILKTQLQPHFLFNTLNSIYSLSIVGSSHTSRLILLLSDMMRYILYDCNNEKVLLSNELQFYKNYFEMEQEKYPEAEIIFMVRQNFDHMIPPMVFLPLIENSFKHGGHSVLDHASVRAVLTSHPNKLEFAIENDIIPNKTEKVKVGGIGLKNIKQRLNLYFPKKHKLTILENGVTHRTEVVLFY